MTTVAAQSAGTTNTTPVIGLDQPSPLRSALRHWIITLLLAAIGLAAGGYYGYSRPDIITAESRVSVGTPSIAAFQIPGFASAAQTLAANYARFVGQRQYQGQIQTALGADAQRITNVSASPLPDSLVIRIEVSADSNAVAKRGAQAVTTAFMAQVNATASTNSPARALAGYSALATKVAQVEADQARAETTFAVARNANAKAAASVAGDAGLSVTDPASRESVAKASAAVVSLKAQVATLTLLRDTAKSQYQDLETAPAPQSKLVLNQAAAVTGGTRRSAVERYGLAGLVGGLVLGLVVATGIDRRRAAGAQRRAVSATEGYGSGQRGDRPTGATPAPGAQPS